jgi:hypothetical protein
MALGNVRRALTIAALTFLQYYRIYSNNYLDTGKILENLIAILTPLYCNTGESHGLVKVRHA